MALISADAWMKDFEYMWETLRLRIACSGPRDENVLRTLKSTSSGPACNSNYAGKDPRTSAPKEPYLLTRNS